MSHDFIQNAVNALYQSNELMALKGELANLKAERDQLKADLEKSDGVVWTLSVENARLKEEVERLTDKIRVSDNHAQCLEFVINSGTANELRLQAQVERLTKAGDDLETWVLILRHNNPTDIEDLRLVVLKWHAAKGVQS